MACNRRTAAKTFLAGLAASSMPTLAHGAEDAFCHDGPCETLKTQVCVIGGGSGGTGAALAAARTGAEVVLLERESILGGTSTNAWVCNWEPATGVNGIPKEIYAAMQADPLGVTYPDYQRGVQRRGGQRSPFEPRAFNLAALRLLNATERCRILLGVTFHRAHVQNDRITAVEAWFHGKHLRIEAEIFIDSTADGDVCADAGCEFHLGEDPKSLYQEPSAPEKADATLNSMTLCYRITDTGAPQKPYLPSDIPEGLCPKPVYVMPMPNGDHILNAVDMLNGNALLYEDHGRLMYEAHRRVIEHFHWLQTLDPKANPGWTSFTNGKGYSTWAISGVAPRIGIRESRRFLGDYVLTEQDCQAGVRNQKHSDIVALTDHAVDVHGHKGRLYEVPNGAYGVPFRCLLPKGMKNILIASRAASFSHIAASSCRLSRTMMTLGQAAGTAAAMAVAEHIEPRNVDLAKLQSVLQSGGVAVSI
jgi:hypothetical protein